MQVSAVSNKEFGAEFLWRCLAWFHKLGYLLLASCGTLGRCSRNPWVPRKPSWESLLYIVLTFQWKAPILCHLLDVYS